MADQQEHRRMRTIYVRDDDHDLWEHATAYATENNLALSTVISHALRDYRPIRTWKARQRRKIAA